MSALLPGRVSAPQAPWLVAVASLIPLAAAMASNVPLEAPVEADATPLAEPPAAYREELPDPVQPHRVLVIGDSHTAGTFGRSLDLLLRTLPETEVKTVGSCGLSPDGFLESKGTRCGYLEIDDDELAYRKRTLATPDIGTLLRKHEPDLTIVELGANQINTAMKDPEGAASDIRALANKVLTHSSRCIWVGPPYGASDKKPPKRIDNVYSVLADALPDGCDFVDSRPRAIPQLHWAAIVKSAKRRGDGKHFDTLGVHGQHASRMWARRVFEQAREVLERPRPVPVPGLVLADAALLAAF